MSDPPFGPEIPSPCVSLCRIDDGTKLCRGCHRTMDEIIQWPTLTNAEKVAVWKELWARKKTAGDP
ncbi:MAG: DUF1289 domain-containing protein [Pseudomonadota bacterium]